jgi:hypothetical protein
MPFSTENMIAFQEREEEARKASLIPEGKYNWEIEVGEVNDVNGLPRLRVVQHVISSDSGKHVGRLHSEFFSWFASENSESESPIEQRQRNLRGMMTRKLDTYLSALSDSPTSNQEIGESLAESIKELRTADEIDDVREILTGIGLVLEGQQITGAIKHSKTGWTNLYPETFNGRVGAAATVAV